jgi:uncharacterized integral membrane protein
MRLTFIVLAVIFLLGGLLFGALNPAPLEINFYFGRQELAAGVALLAAALLGALLAGIVLALAVVWPMQRRLRRLQRQSQTADSPDS